MKGTLKFSPGEFTVFIGSPNLVTIAVLTSLTMNKPCARQNSPTSIMIMIAVYDFFKLIL